MERRITILTSLLLIGSLANSLWHVLCITVNRHNVSGDTADEAIFQEVVSIFKLWAINLNRANVFLAFQNGYTSRTHHFGLVDRYENIHSFIHSFESVGRSCTHSSCALSLSLSLARSLAHSLTLSSISPLFARSFPKLYASIPMFQWSNRTVRNTFSCTYTVGA